MMRCKFKFFKKPDWLRPEINCTFYWLHIGILAIIVQYVLDFLGYAAGGLFTVHTLYFAGAIALADVVAHTLLQLD